MSYDLSSRRLTVTYFSFFNDTPPTEIYTLSLHDALPILISAMEDTGTMQALTFLSQAGRVDLQRVLEIRSEEHTSELQSLTNLVCRLLLQKKKHLHLELRVRDYRFRL